MKRYVTAMVSAIAAIGVLVSAGPVQRPPDAIRLNNLAVARMNQQNMTEALGLLDQAVRAVPESTVPQLNRGIALLNIQRVEEAQAVLEAVVRTDPGNARAHFNLGLLHRSAGRPEAAVEAFRRVTALDGADPDAHYFTGVALAQLQQTNPAMTAFRRAIELFPFHVSAHFGLARALQQSGREEEARLRLAEFQRLTQERLGTPVSVAYGEQGKYSRGEEIVGPQGRVPADSRLSFTPVDPAGLRHAHRGSPTRLPEADRLAAALGSGSCVIDADGDQRPDVLLLDSEQPAVSLFRNRGRGAFTDLTASSGLGGSRPAVACTAADFDNDGRADVAVSTAAGVRLYRNLGGLRFEDVTAASGIRTAGQPLGLTFVDFDHDGDADLLIGTVASGSRPDPDAVVRFAAGAGGLSLWRNNGNRTFTDWSAEAGIRGEGSGIAAVLTDINNDRAVDLVMTGPGGASLAVNPREGPFRISNPWPQLPERPAGIAVFDFDKDGWMDVAFSHWSAAGVSVWRNLGGTAFERVPLPRDRVDRGWGLAAFDADNDGWIDIAVAVERDGAGALRLFRNRGNAGFTDVTSDAGLATVRLEGPRSLVTLDYDQDGDSDLLLSVNGGRVRMFRNDGGHRNPALRLTFTGLNDNKSAVGTKVEVFAGESRQKWEIAAASGYLGQSSMQLIAASGGGRSAEIVRMLWPTGVLQDETQVAAGTPRVITEIDRRGSSCPVLFSWDGSKFRFITDAIGGGIMGHWVAPGERNISDPDEYIKVDGDAVRERDGRLHFRFMEPMEEVIYLDQVRLLAIDHPAGADVYPHEYFASAPPFPGYRVIVAESPRPVTAAQTHRGRPVLDELRHRDRRFAGDVQSIAFKGFAETHWLELDLGPWDAGRPLRLLMHGYIDYFSDTSIFAAHQAGVHPMAVTVDYEREGKWHRVPGDIGFPAGLRRTMVADLTGRLPAGANRIRLATNLKIYWDQILVDNSGGRTPFVETEVPLVRADLSFHGYPRQRAGSPKSDVEYVYDEISPTGPYARHAGAYTAFGDVRDLLHRAEDRFAVFGSGEQVELEFDARVLPPLREGWTRDYFFYADGFTKDMDFYAAYSQTVEPLPFHAMGRYPYSAPPAYPTGRAYLDYLLGRNSRLVSGGSGPARFVYPSPR